MSTVIWVVGHGSERSRAGPDMVGWGVLRGIPAVVGLLLCKSSRQNQVSNHMLTTSLFILGISAGLAYADYLKRQLRK